MTGSQQLVRATMLAAGGYWRPLAAAARLLEELGELVELLERPEPDRPAIAAELADLWIITSALADQFLAEVPEPGTSAEPRAAASAAGLVVAAGPIARVVNHYDGPKTPRAAARLPSLSESILAFHRELDALAAALGVDLGTAVAEKLEAIRERGDLTRFAREAFDPVTADCLRRYSEAVAAGRRAPALWRLWGAPELGPTGAGGNAARIAPSLLRFARAARAEDLQGFVVAGPAPAGTDQRRRWAGELLGALAALDPAPQAAGHADADAEHGAVTGSGFRFAGLPLRAALLPRRQGADEDAGSAEEAFLLLIPSG